MKTKNILILFSLSFGFIQADYIEGRWNPGGFSNTMYEFVDGLRYTYYCSENSCDSDYWDSLDTSDAIPTPNPYWVDGNTISIDLHFGNTATYTMNFRCEGQIVDFYYDEDDNWEGLHSSMFRTGFDYTTSDCVICSYYDEVYCSWMPECQWEESNNIPGGGSCIDNTYNSDWDSYCEEIYIVEDCINNSGCYLEYDNSNNSFCQGYDDDNLNFSLLNETLDQYMEAINLLDLNVIDGLIGEVVFEDSDDLDFGDNIGLLDFNGGNGFNDCGDVDIEGLGNVVVVGVGKWLNEPLIIPIYSHINDCNLSPITYPGFIEGNPIYFYAWDDSGENFRQLIPEGRPEYNFTTDIIQVNNINFRIECEDGEVDLGWGNCNDWSSSHSDGCMSSGCYSIEETTFIQFYETTGNLLQGEISSNIGDLVNLTLLRLDDINQLSGPIPTEIGNLTNLSILTLENNQLTGEIPSEIGNTNLEILKLTNNQLTGYIPSEIWNLTNLRQLNLSDNQLTGEIPSEIEFLTSLTDLELANNQLTGEIPIELWSMNQNSLDFFDLSNNQLTGEIPDEIENSMFIFQFYLNDNQLSGIIPENTCEIVFLPSYSDQFKFGNNNFCPPYPSCLVNLEPFIDENGNGEWDEGESYEDSNGNGVYEENYVGEQNTSDCEESLLGDVNEDQMINVLDIVSLVSLILEGGFIYSGDMNQDNTINVQDIVLLVQNILNPPLDEGCFIIPEIGPCDGICPTYFYNQNTNQCEEFITGCCGVEAFDTMEECQNNCE